MYSLGAEPGVSQLADFNFCIFSQFFSRQGYFRFACEKKIGKSTVFGAQFSHLVPWKEGSRRNQVEKG
ncbi:hypothetical protein RRG08_045044 [Elysia crispata]|uniref:Uncharacterized protein n=1 Tax=Elysia crispata TaxID=231223 RepID=A0AAE0XTQ3_9GAST|nr:hypothetical protein RRG08_045044 [Elysia crispata]